MDQNNTQQLPNATGVLVLGILSIALCWTFGLFGIICGIVALILAKKPMAMLKENPTGFSNAGNLKSGRIMAIIGLAISGLILLYYIIMFAIVGSAALSVFSMLKNSGM